jgi:hypothetical protein
MSVLGDSQLSGELACVHCVPQVFSTMNLGSISYGALDNYLHELIRTVSLERFQQIEALALDLPAISRRASGEVLGSVGVTLHGPQQPVEDGFAESATVSIAQGTAVADRNVTLPDRDTRCHVPVVTLTLMVTLAH